MAATNDTRKSRARSLALQTENQSTTQTTSDQAKNDAPALPSIDARVFLGMAALRPAGYKRGDSEDATRVLISMLDLCGALLELETQMGEGEENMIIALCGAFQFSKFAQEARNAFRRGDANETTTDVILPASAFEEDLEKFWPVADADFSLRMFGAKIFRGAYLLGCAAAGNAK